MTNTMGGVLRKKISATQTRGYRLPIQNELSATLEYAGLGYLKPHSERRECLAFYARHNFILGI